MSRYLILGEGEREPHCVGASSISIWKQRSPKKNQRQSNSLGYIELEESDYIATCLSSNTRPNNVMRPVVTIHREPHRARVAACPFQSPLHVAVGINDNRQWEGNKHDTRMRNASGSGPHRLTDRTREMDWLVAGVK